MGWRRSIDYNLRCTHAIACNRGTSTHRPWQRRLAIRSRKTVWRARGVRVAILLHQQVRVPRLANMTGDGRAHGSKRKTAEQVQGNRWGHFMQQNIGGSSGVLHKRVSFSPVPLRRYESKCESPTTGFPTDACDVHICQRHMTDNVHAQGASRKKHGEHNHVVITIHRATEQSHRRAGNTPCRYGDRLPTVRST